MKYLIALKEILKSDIILLIMLINMIPIFGLSIYLKILDGNYWSKEISFETFGNHPILSIWYFSHVAILLILSIYKYIIKKEY